jgi:hypothetical protein
MVWFFLMLVPVFAQSNEVDLSPEWRGKQFLVVRGSEEALPPLERINLLIGRASQVCEYLKAPAGRYRSYKAARVNTKRVSSLGQEVAVLEKRSGRFSVRGYRLPKEDRSEVLTAVRCQGNP